MELVLNNIIIWTSMKIQINMKMKKYCKNIDNNIKNIIAAKSLTKWKKSYQIYGGFWREKARNKKNAACTNESCNKILQI